MRVTDGRDSGRHGVIQEVIEPKPAQYRVVWDDMSWDLLTESEMIREDITPRAAYDLGDRVRHIGTGYTGVVADFKVSTHPAFADEILVHLDGGKTMLSMNKERDLIWFYATGLEPVE